MTEGKLTRRLTIKLQPISQSAFAVTFIETTSRPVAGVQDTHTRRADDSFNATSIPEALALKFKEFRASIAEEDPAELFPEPKKGGAVEGASEDDDEDDDEATG